MSQRPSVLDVVKVPNLKPGKYVLGFIESLEGSIVGLHSRRRHLLLHHTSRSGVVAL